MQLAKPRVDIGLSTNDLAPMLAFWQDEAGMPFDHLLPIRPGQDQHRHDANGSVLKINHHSDPLPDAEPSGYLELIVARPGVTAPKAMRDPEGNRLRLVPPGWEGVGQAAIRIGCRDLAAHRRFYAQALGLPEERPGVFRAGETLIFLEQDAKAPADAGMRGAGWRYITFQVFGVDEEHARAVVAGAREAMAPLTLGRTARISMIRDPDGNWIELSQRASIVGSLEPGGAASQPS